MANNELAARSDARLQATLDQADDKQEALTWIKQAGKPCFIGESSENLTAADSLRLIERLYEHGSTQVVAIDIEDAGPIESTSTLIVALPDSEPQREAIFAIESEIASQGGFDGTPDYGQRYLMLHW